MNDLKFAFRQLGKSPAFTAIAVLTLALGIGANSAIFSVINAVLLHPLPFPKPNQLVAVWSKVANDNLEKQTESIPNYVDLRDQSQTLVALAAFTRSGAVLNGTEEARQLHGVAITSDIFPVLGVAAAIDSSGNTRIALGAVASRPFLVENAGEFLKGKKLTDEVIADVDRMLAAKEKEILTV